MSVDPADGVIECEDVGGIVVEEEASGDTFEICSGAQGEQGEQGEEGSPWTDLGVLPPGESETGTWAFNASEEDGGKIVVPISFPIPMALDLNEPVVIEEEDVHFQTDSDFETFCKVDGLGSVFNPKAQPGQLCIFYNENDSDTLVNATFEGAFIPRSIEEPGAGLSGAILKFAFSGSPGDAAHGFGSWAVTTPLPAP